MAFEEPKTTVQILGLKWDSDEDSLGYDFSSIQFVLTKRGVLFVIARIFDPLGFFLFPVVLFAKHVTQLIWISEVAWNDKLPSEIMKIWLQFISDLPALSFVRVPRFLGSRSGSTYLLCGFCDASMCGCAGLVCLRIVQSNG